MAKKKTSNNEVIRPEVLPLQRLVDTRLTRSEIIDLVLSEVTAEMQREYEKLGEEMERLQSLPKEVAIELLRGTRAKFLLKKDYHSNSWLIEHDSEEWAARFINGKHPTIASTVARLNEINERRELLNKRIREIRNDRGAAKNFIIRQTLLSSPEGREIMADIERLKASLREGIQRPQLGAGGA